MRFTVSTRKQKCFTFYRLPQGPPRNTRSPRPHDSPNTIICFFLDSLGTAQQPIALFVPIAPSVWAFHKKLAHLLIAQTPAMLQTTKTQAKALPHVEATQPTLARIDLPLGNTSAPQDKTFSYSLAVVVWPLPTFRPSHPQNRRPRPHPKAHRSKHSAPSVSKKQTAHQADTSRSSQSILHRGVPFLLQARV